MDALLSPVSTTYTKSAVKEEPFLQEVKKSPTASSAAPTAPTAPARQAFTASSPDEALEVLKNEPDYATLVSVLRFLLSAKSPVDVRKPTPLSAQLVQALVTGILPHYWTVLREQGEDSSQQDGPRKHSGRTDLELLLACLRSVTGLSSLSVRLRALLAEQTIKKNDDNENYEPGNPAWQIRILLEVLSELLAGDEAVAQVWSVSISETDDDARTRPLQQEFLNMIGSGKIVSLAAEAETIVREAFSSETVPPVWIANGREYSLWMTRNIIHWALQNTHPRVQAAQGALLGKALRLGYLDSVVSVFVTDLVLGDSLAKDDNVLATLLQQLPAYEQKKMLNGILKFAADTWFSSLSAGPETVDAGAVSAVAGLVERVLGTSTALRDQLVSWLLTSPGVGLINGIGIRRAAVAVVSKDQSALSDILEKSMAEFGDQLFIKHAPMMQQEAKAQIILLAAAYVGRRSQRSLASLLRSRAYLSLVSNRLGASQNRARFLGMAVGEALSGLVDDNKQKLDFHMDEMNTDEAKWYKGLAKVNDSVGKPDMLKKQTPSTVQTSASTKTSKAAKAAKPKQAKSTPAPITAGQTRTSGFIIEELNDDNDNDDDDDDLKAYGKPDSDTEDSDDDPTLVRRDKPKAPVYIRDLISFFRDTENYDKQKLALATAPLLIRRKATFGTEVQQHARDLASILISLHNTFEIEDFGSLCLQGMVALAVAQPKLIGPYYALTFFEGDYSLSQRASVLSALGLAARELAGFDVSEYAAESAFPTKQLPGRVEHLYVPPEGSQPGAKLGGPSSLSSLKALGAGALDSITDSLTASFLRPIAAKAADEATGPDVLKLTSFKSRLQDVSSGSDARAVTRKKQQQQQHQPAKGAVNTSSQLLASSMFFPLISRFQLAALQSSSSARLRGGVLFEPSLLALYIRTLAVVLHAAGPSALALPDMTAELWTLLLSSSVQAHCVGDLLVTHAVLFALMAVLDVNENRVRELCRDLPREVVQTRDWALQVVENMRMAGAEAADQRSQESEVQMLAAGIYIRLSEGMESYRSLLLGEMIG